MSTETISRRPFQSEKIEGDLYIDNNIAFGKQTEVGLDLNNPVTFNGVENVHRISMLVSHSPRTPTISVLAKEEHKSSGDVIKYFSHGKDKEVFEWILEHIEP